MRTEHQIVTNIKLCKALFTHPTVGNSNGTKGTRCVPHSLIAVHEEAADEGAHEQLMQTDSAYDTEIHPYQRRVKRLELFRRWSHGCQLGLSHSSGLLPSFFSTSWTKTEGSSLGKEWN
jgi:hypothetical protein